MEGEQLDMIPFVKELDYCSWRYQGAFSYAVIYIDTRPFSSSTDSASRATLIFTWYKPQPERH